MIAWKAIVVLVGLGNLAFGLVAVTAPGRVAAFIGLSPNSPAAVGELRAVFGGLVIALGLLLAAAPWRPEGPTIVWVIGTCFAGLALGRVVSLFADGSATYTWLGLALEGISAAVLFLAANALRAR